MATSSCDILQGPLHSHMQLNVRIKLHLGCMCESPYLWVNILILGVLLSDNGATQPGQLTSINKKGISIIQPWMFGNMCKYKEGVDVIRQRMGYKPTFGISFLLHLSTSLHEFNFDI